MCWDRVPFFCGRRTHRFHDTARLLCVIYAEICVKRPLRVWRNTHLLVRGRLWTPRDFPYSAVYITRGHLWGRILRQWRVAVDTCHTRNTRDGTRCSARAAPSRWHGYCGHTLRTSFQIACDGEQLIRGEGEIAGSGLGRWNMLLTREKKPSFFLWTSPWLYNQHISSCCLSSFFYRSAFGWMYELRESRNIDARMNNPTNQTGLPIQNYPP